MNLNYARYLDKWVGLAICLVLFCFDRVIGRFFGRHLPSLLATTPPPLDAEPHGPRRVLCIKFYGLGNAIMLLRSSRRSAGVIPAQSSTSSPSAATSRCSSEAAC